MPTSRLVFFICISSIFWVTVVFASSTGSKKLITIEADQAVLDEIKQTGIYTGNIILKQSGIEVKADSMVVYTNKGKLKQVILEGDPVNYRQKQKGNDDIRGVSNRIEYDTERKQIFMLGNAELWQGENRFSGDRIQYDTEQKKVIATGDSEPTKSKKQRVEIILQPKSSQTQDQEQ